MLQNAHNCSSTKNHDYLDASENSKPVFPNRRYLPTLPQSVDNRQSLFNTKFHRASSAMTFLVSLSLSTPVPNCQTNHHASGLNPQVTSQCKHPSSSTVPAHYRTSGVQHFIHVATKPRSLTKQTRPSRFSCQLLSILRQLNLVTLRPFRVLMPNFSHFNCLSNGN